MDEAQVRALFESMIGAVKTELTDQIHIANQGLGANLSKQIAKLQTPKAAASEPAQPEGEEGKVTLKALQTQIAELNKTLADQKQAAFAAASETALTNAIAQSGTNNPKILKKLLQAEYGGRLSQDGDNWFLVDGDNAVGLSQAVLSFLQSDDGKFFLPPSGTKGSGAMETTSAIAPKDNLSLSQQLEAAFKPKQ